MKKRKIKTLQLNKKVISKLENVQIKGGASDHLDSGCTCPGGGGGQLPTGECRWPTDGCDFCLMWSLWSNPPIDPPTEV
ncbi:MAG: hypothetical protein AAF617_03250 [Bacteroidota bacterium]